MGPVSRDDHELLALLRKAVEYLESENADGRIDPNRPVGTTPADVRNGLRRLLTIRPPAPLPTHVHEWVDTILQNERDAVGTVDAGSLAPVSTETPNTWFAPAE